MCIRDRSSTGLKVSRLCFGTMSFGGDADRTTSEKMYQTAREAGINFFDTANIYNKGASENYLGEFIKHERDNIIVATKAYFPTSEALNDRGNSRRHLIQAVEMSLKRLNTDRIDLFYLHRFDEKTDLLETARALEHLVSSGKVLHLGVSNFSAWQAMKLLGLQRAHGWAPLVAVQPMYNLVKRQVESEILPLCLSENIACIPYSPLAAGLLSGKYSKRGPGRAGGRIKDVPMYASRYSDKSYYQTAEKFCEYAEKKRLNPVSLAVAWVLAQPGVTSPILGARNAQQLTDSLGALNIEIEEHMVDVSATSRAPSPATDRSEEGGKHQLANR